VFAPFRAQAEVQKDGVELWWPAGHGGQKLYDATVTWQPAPGNGGAASCGDAAVLDADQLLQGSDAAPGAAAPGHQAYYCSAAKRQIGFRTVELVMLPLADAARELATGAAAATGADAEGAGAAGARAGDLCISAASLNRSASHVSPAWCLDARRHPNQYYTPNPTTSNAKPQASPCTSGSTALPSSSRAPT
jgi:hypothetical protein